MAAKKLVVVESPAKAKTIGTYLGPDYEVLASVGHIRDLHAKSSTLPEEVRKKPWAKFSTDIENGYEPYYTFPDDRSRENVRRLKQAMKGKDTLILATDEDREGESISWHILDELKPPKSVKVERIAFHEITKDAIRHAIQHPRTLDMDLVEAQEARRILDRLYGYSVSEELWRIVQRGTSAGRVQSPAIRLIVERERERRAFRSATYWDLVATFGVARGEFRATLRTVGGKPVASGRDFAPTTGELLEDRVGKVVHLDEQAVNSLLRHAKTATYEIGEVEQKERKSRPAAPFMTTTLQQEANRKLGFPSERTMRVAQGLYEGIEIGGERTGLITYMRTDSNSLAKEAVEAIREHIGKRYHDCLPLKANQYSNKVKNAQEAHEGIRPTDVERTPERMRPYLSEEQFRLYDLIWKRTVASQMSDARLLDTRVDVNGTPQGGDALGFRATGTQVLFDGYMRIYREGRDDADDEAAMLPPITKGEPAKVVAMGTDEHATSPPPRYTDATLIKRLEELGIGRPSTYASIIKTLRDRSYARMQGKALAPSWLAFGVVQALESGFGELVDYGFTARMDSGLDDISNGKKSRAEYLEEFFRGDEESRWPGLEPMIAERRGMVPFFRFEIGRDPDSGKPVAVRIGKNLEAFLQLGENDDEEKTYADVPEDVAPAELTLDRALELLKNRSRSGGDALGFHPTTGRRLLLKNKSGYYLEVERTEEEIARKEKPIFVSVPQNEDPRTLSQEDLNDLSNMPLTIGEHPELKAPIQFKMGKYGPYIEAGTERRTVEDWRMFRGLTVARAVEILAQPKGRPVRQAAAPLKEFGVLDGCAGPVRVLSGRFGPYVTDGETNATLPKAITPAHITEEQAIELLANKRAAGPPVKKAPARRAPATRKPATRRRN